MLLIILILSVLVFLPMVIILIFHSGNPFAKAKPASKGHLKKDQILKVNVKNGRWWCPSCGDSNLEIKKDCGSCGQRVEKTTP